VACYAFANPPYESPNSCLDNNPNRGLYTLRPVHSGASSRGVLVMGSDAAPAGGVRNLAPGRSRVAVRAHYGALPSMAGRGLVKAGESPLGSLSVLGRSDRKPAPGSTAPRTEKPRGAPEGAVHCLQAMHARKTRSRRPARHSPNYRGTRKGHRRDPRRSNNRACGALAKGLAV